MKTRNRCGWWRVPLVLCVACGDARSQGDADAGDELGTGVESEAGSADDGAESDDEGSAKLDVGGGSGTPNPAACTVPTGSIDAVGSCTDRAAPDSFSPEVQWSFSPETHFYALAGPRVINLTDDNGDGVIDLCDTPDVVVVGYSFLAENMFDDGRIFVLDGATGALHFMIDTPVHPTSEPAVGDIDGDGIAEIVTLNPWTASELGEMQVLAFEHDGSLKWASERKWRNGEGSGLSGAALGLADMDNDGDVEIYGGDAVYDHHGKTVFITDQPVKTHSAHAAADLDGDGALEFIMGNAAFHYDGSLHYRYDYRSFSAGYPQVADFDDDGLPEVLVSTGAGLNLLEHDGTLIYSSLKPLQMAGELNSWNRPSTVHDFDSDGLPEFAMSAGSFYAVYEADGTPLWDATVRDNSGIAAGTAFDFLGDGTPEAMYADETHFFAFDEQGQVLMDVPRTSRTIIDYPVVADVDNDGSAEVVVVSSDLIIDDGTPETPMVQVIRDVEDRWIQARRIWNQQTYHVTNVREDGTIPQFEPPSWEMLNTYRTNSQILPDGSVCVPPVG